MCLIIHKPNADTIIPQHILDNAENINPDGFGIVYTDNNECIRTMDYNHATVADLGDKQLCDTYVVADMLKRMPNKYWNDLLSMTETRFAITYPDGSVARHGKWHEKDGVFYSKNNCFYTRQSTIGYHYGKTYAPKYKTYEDYWDNDWYDTSYDMSDTSSVYEDKPIADPYDWQDVDLVAVYGTLKSGHTNHDVLGDSSLVGVGKTVSKYAMQKSGIPYVYEHEHRDQINVEVYEVLSDSTKLSLDHLESHPHFYERKLTDIELTDGSVRTCWLYFAQTEPYKNMEYIQTY